MPICGQKCFFLQTATLPSPDFDFSIAKPLNFPILIPLMPEWVATVILGIVEGITEFLPISSTGHLIVVQHFLDDHRSEFFNVGIQSGAVLAVVLIYWKKLMELTLQWKKPENFDYILKCGGAFVVTSILGLASRFAGIELPETLGPVAWAVFLGAILIFWAEKKNASLAASQGTTEEITWKIAIIVGVAQVVAGIFPGTSRSAATIIAAMLLGTSRMKATEFSFLLGIPTMFAAGAYTLFSQIKKTGTLPPSGEIDQFIIGFVVSMGVAFIAVKWLLEFIRTNSFIPFAWYRLVLGLLLLIWLGLN